jgi:hypothetical protein
MNLDPIIPPARRQALRAAGLWRDRTLLSWFDEAVAADPARIAIVDARSGAEERRISYRELDQASRRIAANLVRMGVRRGDVVAFQLPNWWQFAVEVPMFETMAAMVLGDHLGGRSFVPPEGETGYARLLAQARRPYATADGHICALVYSDRQWESFCALIGRPEMFRQDPRLRDLGTRTRHIDALYTLVEQTLRTRSTGEWLELLGQADIPCMPMHTLESLLEDPHLQAVGFFQQIAHPSEGRLLSLSVPSRWSATPPDAPRPAPRLGEHTAAVLAEAGIDAPAAGTP